MFIGRMSTLLNREFIKIIDRFEENNEKNLAFSLDTDKKIPSMVRLNSNVFDVIEILLSNAVKYSKNQKNQCENCSSR